MQLNKAILILLTALTLPGGAFLIPSGAGELNQKPGKVPNLLIDVSAAMVNGAVQRPVDRTEPVQEIILETPICGMSRALGNIRAELVPGSNHAAVDIVLHSRVFSQSVGTRPYVLVYTYTTTGLEVRRRILIDGNGIRAFAGPCCAESSICLVDIKCRQEPDHLAIRFAEIAFQQSKAEGEAEIARKTARRASDRMAEELSPALASASKSVTRGLTIFKQAGLTPEFLDFNTTATNLQARLRIATPGSVPPTPSPSLPAETDLGLRVHQSLFNEAARVSLRGKTISLNEVSKFYDEVTQGFLRDARSASAQKIGLQKVEKLIADLTKKPTKINLAEKDPLTISFTDQGFTIEIHIASIHQEEKTFSGMRVQAAYQLVNSRQGVQLVRAGPVRFSPSAQPSASEKKLEAQPVSMVLFREILFAEVLKERLLLNDLPVTAPVSQLRLQAPRADTANGWLLVTWKLGTRPEEKPSVPSGL